MSHNDDTCLHKVISWERDSDPWLGSRFIDSFIMLAIDSVLIFVLTLAFNICPLFSWIIIKSERMFCINFSTDFWDQCAKKSNNIMIFLSQRFLFKQISFFFSHPKFPKKERKISWFFLLSQVYIRVPRLEVKNFESVALRSCALRLCGNMRRAAYPRDVATCDRILYHAISSP